MVKLNILKGFCDKYTNERYKVGSTIEVKEKRAKEILASSLKLAELVEGEVLDDDDDDDVTGDKPLEELNLKQLKKLAKEKNITVDGTTKEDYLNALKDVE